MNSKPNNKKYICKNGRYLPISLSVTLAEIEEAAELIYDEVQDVTTRLFQQHFTNTVPTRLFLQVLLHQLLCCIRRTMNVDTVAVLLKTEDKQHLAVYATFGLEEEITEEVRIPVGCGFAGCVAASGEVTLVDDLSKVKVVSPILRNKGINSMLGVPLLDKGRSVVGVFHVGAVRPCQFTMEDTQLLQLVAEHVGSISLYLSQLDCSADSKRAYLNLFTAKL